MSRVFDIEQLSRSAIGFDYLAKLLEDTQRSSAQLSYPPYNVEQLGADQYRITMAVAGFDRSELEIETERDALKITGRKRKEEQKSTFLHRGIGTRDFEHRFQLADHVKVASAALENGLLNIELVREVPEALKPRKISIGGGQNVELIEQRQAA